MEDDVEVVEDVVDVVDVVDDEETTAEDELLEPCTDEVEEVVWLDVDCD